MTTDSTITLSSIYRRQPLFELALSYGKLNFIAPDSGMGKTALGLFLKTESYRRLKIQNSGTSFVPKLDWELVAEGPFGFVEFLSNEGLRGKLKDYLNIEAPLVWLFRQKGKTSCPRCGAEIFSRESKELAIQVARLQGNYVLLGIDLTIKPDAIFSLLEWARAHSISRVLIGGAIKSLPKTPSEDALWAESLFTSAKVQIMLIREVIKRDSLESDFSQSLGNVVTLAEVATSSIRVKALPKLLVGEIRSDIERFFTVEKELVLSSPYICLSCGTGLATLPQSKIGEFTLEQILQSKLKDLEEFFGKNFASDWQRLFELSLGDLSLVQSVDEIPFGLLTELKLLSLILSEVRDSVIFVDARLSKKGRIYAVELSMLGNCIVSQLEEGSSLANFLPPELQRPSEILNKHKEEQYANSKRQSIEPLFVEVGIEKAIVGLYASLPEARVRNLIARDLSFHAAKCMDCGGSGYSVVSISSLGKRAEICRVCLGSRFQEKVLFVKYQDISLAQLLELNIAEANKLFSKRSEIASQLSHLIQLGLGSYQLGDEWRTMPSRAKAFIGDNR